MDTEVGKGQEVRDRLLQTRGVVAADLAMGPHDLVVVVEEPTIEEVGRIVVRDLHGIPGVKNTITMIVINRD